MTKILLVNGKELQATEEKETIFELIQDNKQFIFIKERYSSGEDEGSFSRAATWKYRQIAININYIVEVF